MFIMTSSLSPLTQCQLQQEARRRFCAGLLGVSVTYFQGGRRVWRTPGMLMMGVLGRLVGNGQGHDGVPGVGRDGTTVGVVEFDEVGGVFRLGGGGWGFLHAVVLAEL